LVSEIRKENVLVEVREHYYEGGYYKPTANIRIGDTKIEMERSNFSDCIHTLGHILVALTDYLHHPMPEA